MFKKKSEGLNIGEIETVLGPRTKFAGNIEAIGNVRIDGQLIGDVNIDGNLILGEDASVTGNISANIIELGGRVEGNINAAQMLKLNSTAVLHGDIKVQTFVTDEGAVFEGKCTMTSPDTQGQPSGKASKKKGFQGKDYKKSSLIDQIADDKEKPADAE